MVDNLLSGPVAAFLLVGQNAIQNLLCLAGDIDPGIAKLKHPSSLRAVYGRDFMLNAVHVSESPGCVLKVLTQSVNYPLLKNSHRFSLGLINVLYGVSKVASNFGTRIRFDAMLNMLYH
jgi:hypothetical protein